MKRLTSISWMMFGVGALLMVGGVVLGVSAGGVPNPDGPNSGQVSGPGAGRAMDQLGEWVFTGGFAILIVGLLGLFIAGVAWCLRRV